MGNILLTAINAKFIHSSLALRSISAYCGGIETAEYTINNDSDYILAELYKRKPAVIGFSCYIWNIEIILELICNIKKLLPEIIVVLGGPEVSYEYEHLFEKGADIIVIGEGEKTWYDLKEYYKGNIEELKNIDGIAYMLDGNIVVTKPRLPIELDEIPFIYKDNLEELKHRIIYYEASRGCPYNCQYCLSSIEKGIRFLSIERVRKDLQYFLDNNVRQVKFVDRTFNARKQFAMEIWQYLIDNDNGITNFHFEISADILDDEMLEILKNARPQLFQLEIGVQSTNIGTLGDIKRKTHIDRLFEKVKTIKKFGNIHQHLDLIAGLPNEDIRSFKQSFNDVYAVKPEQLQLGFLKLLRGSGLRRDAEKWGIVYREKSPYEVLYTDSVSYDEMLRLKSIEEMVETYYNSGKAIYTLKFMLSYFESPYDMYESLAVYWEESGFAEVSHNKMKLYSILFEFCRCYIRDTDKLQDIIKFDMFLNDNVKNIPQWLESKDIKEYIREFYNEVNIEKYTPKLMGYTPKQVSRMCHMEYFEYDIYNWIENGELEKKGSYILFDYYAGNDLMGNVKWYKVG